MSVKKYVGKVVSAKMQATVVVAVELPKRHPIYNKLTKNTKRLKAHCDMPVELGAVVEVVETKPYSKQVAFKVEREVKEK